MATKRSESYPRKNDTESPTAKYLRFTASQVAFLLDSWIVSADCRFFFLSCKFLVQELLPLLSLRQDPRQRFHPWSRTTPWETAKYPAFFTLHVVHPQGHSGENELGSFSFWSDGTRIPGKAKGAKYYSTILVRAQSYHYQ